MPNPRKKPKPETVADDLVTLVTRNVRRRKDTAQSDVQWLWHNAIDPETGEQAFSRRTADRYLGAQEIRGYMETSVYRALANVCEVEPMVVLMANGITNGVPPLSRGRFAASLSGLPMDELPDYVQDSLREQAIVACRLAGLLER